LKLDAKRAKPAPGVALRAPAVAASSTLTPQPSVAVKLNGQPAKPAPAVESAGHLYEDYYDRIFGYCLYQLGSREEAEDAAQTTFMWAFRGLRRGVVPRAEANWLFAIAQNACRARHRSRARGREREVLSDPVTLADLSPAPQTETDALMGIEDALARMPELQRRAILLREWRGLSYKEIAAELELSGAAVETLIFRARRSLAELLAGPTAPRRARKYAIDLGSTGAALKSLFGAGSAAKVAAGIAAVVAATTIAVGSVERTRSDGASPARNIPVTVVPQTPRAHPGVGRHSVLKKHGAMRPAVTKPKPSSGASESAPEGSLGSGVGHAIDQTSGTIPVVGDVVRELPLDTATGAVDEAVATVTDAAAPVSDALP
jgi:RNA polymerase sigma-70 factor (ECF subfamily)